MKLRWQAKVFNFFRYLFTRKIFEKALVNRLVSGAPRWFLKLVPPAYLYKPGSLRLVRRDGILLELDVSRLLDHTLYFFGLTDPAWENLFKVTKPDFFVMDIGANIGYVSLRLAKICTAGKVYSFEPDSDTRKSLARNIQLNSFHHVSMYPYALGQRAERALLYKYDPLNPATNRILTQKPIENHDSEWVDVVTLDQFMVTEKLPKIDLIKIDVEGWELFVLKGGEQLIKKWRPILFVELAEANFRQQGYTAAAVVQYIQGLGYRIRDAKSWKEFDAAEADLNIDILCDVRSENGSQLE